MATVFDVAKYILNKKQPLPAMKLHKLLYYSQAWSLVWDDKLLFRAKIKAWANGPVVPAIYTKHRGLYALHAKNIKGGRSRALTKASRETIDTVLKYYGNKSSQWLSDLTFMEKPWKEARKIAGLNGRLERGNVEITHASMAEYYCSL